MKSEPKPARNPAFSQNNLAQAPSPYLRQHQDNPVWWQDWSEAILAEAVRLDLPLFVSSGYATCHWCHVMASQAFSDPTVAAVLNESFICVKIDRELRSDIDQFLMQFLVEMSGQGGWPLNAFLTPDLKPVFALTYATPEQFARIASQVSLFYAGRKQEIPRYELHSERPLAHLGNIDATVTGSPEAGQTSLAPLLPDLDQERQLCDQLLNWHDPIHGGFGSGQKFPPHSSLLFWLYEWQDAASEPVRAACRKTLDVMMTRGLHDHLQGGIFRYCVDRQWTIPHFEKMLYDQAMALWVYALAAQQTGDNAYRDMALSIVRCLDETFAKDGLYLTALDADTDHREGATYVWSEAELAASLSRDEIELLRAAYDLSAQSQFEGKIHLIRRSDSLGLDQTKLKELEAKLLAIRKRRPQPQVDEKILSGQNALLAVALIQAGRFLGSPSFEEKGKQLVESILERFFMGESLSRAAYGQETMTQSFLFDAAALLLAVCLLAETDPDRWLDSVASFVPVVRRFATSDGWLESLAPDFQSVPAAWFDSPTPSPVSLAEFALTHAAYLMRDEVSTLPWRQPYGADFANLAAMLANGGFHIWTSPQALPWQNLPANSIQLRGSPAIDCCRGTCRPY